MYRILLISLLLFISSKSFAQEPADIWYFGYQAGLDFSNGAPVAIEDGAIYTIEGCTTICNDKGDLLFYASGNDVYNKNHELMDNGTGLNGHWSATQAVLTVPFLDDPNKFYLFTLDTPDHATAAFYPNTNPDPRRFPTWTNDGAPDDGYNNGLNYSIVDMTANGGLGKVVQKNTPLVTHNPNDPRQAGFKGGEKLTGIINYNDNSHWIVTHFVNRFYAFKVDENGVNPSAVVSETGPNLLLDGHEFNAIGELKFSPNGHKLAMANQSNSHVNEKNEGDAYLFDFDAETGKVSNPLKILEGDHPYGVEFSPDGSKLYISVQVSNSFSAWIYQFDLTKVDIPSSFKRFTSVQGAGGLQLGPDGNIYKAHPNSNSLGRISNPNRTYYDDQYEFYAVNLSPTRFFVSESKFSLPNYIQSYFEQAITMKSTCSYEKELRLINYTNVASVTWDFGDLKAGQDNFSSEMEPSHKYNKAGEYTVTATVNSTTGIVRVVHKTFSVEDPPIAHPLPDIYACEKESSSYSGYATIATGHLEKDVLEDQTGMLVTFYRDGQLIPNPLPDPYQNQSSWHEEITVRVARRNNPECYSESKFNLFIKEGFHNTHFQDLTGCYDAENDTFTFDFSGVLAKLEQDTDLIFRFEDATGNSITPDAEGIFTTAMTGSKEVILYLQKKGFECERSSRFQLMAAEGPEIVELPEMMGCDEDGDGISEFFDLSEIPYIILEGRNHLEAKIFKLDGSEITTVTTAYTNEIPFEEQLRVVLIDPGNGCSSRTFLKLRTSQKPLVNPLPDQYTCEMDPGYGSFSTANWKQSILGNETSLKIQFYDGSQNALPDPLPATYRNGSPGSETITAVIQNETNEICSTTIQFQLNVNEKSAIDLEDTYVICGNLPNFTLILSRNFETYSWIDQNGTVISKSREVVLTDEGTYLLIAGDRRNGILCEVSHTFQFFRSELPSITGVSYRDWSDNNFIEIEAAGAGDLEYSINGIDFQDDNYFGYLQGGLYTVYVRDREGCGIDTEEIVLIDFPKFFTPNSDGYNDLWNIVGIDQLSEYDILIFDRYGKLLKHLTKLDRGWDGNFNGIQMPADDYWFRLELLNGKLYKNHFSLVR